MNTFDNLSRFFVTHKENDINRTRKLQRIIKFIEIMNNLENEELETDDFDWIDDIINGTADEVIKDFFTYKANNGNTILHELFEYIEFLNSIYCYASHIDFSIEGKSKLTPLELAVNTMNYDAVGMLLELGAPISSFRDERLLVDVSFDGREFSDLASESGMDIDQYVQDGIHSMIKLLETKGAIITTALKDEATNFQVNLF